MKEKLLCHCGSVVDRDTGFDFFFTDISLPLVEKPGAGNCRQNCIGRLEIDNFLSPTIILNSGQFFIRSVEFVRRGTAFSENVLKL